MLKKIRALFKKSDILLTKELIDFTYKRIDESPKLSFFPEEQILLSSKKISNETLKAPEHITEKEGYEAELVLDMENKQLKQTLKYNGHILQSNIAIQYKSYLEILKNLPYLLDKNHRNVMLTGFINHEIEKAERVGKIKSEERHGREDWEEKNAKKSFEDNETVFHPNPEAWVVDFYEINSYMRDCEGERVTKKLINQLKELDSQISLQNEVFNESQEGFLISFTPFYPDDEGESIKVKIGAGNEVNDETFRYLYEEVERIERNLYAETIDSELNDITSEELDEEYKITGNIYSPNSFTGSKIRLSPINEGAVSLNKYYSDVHPVTELYARKTDLEKLRQSVSEEGLQHEKQQLPTEEIQAELTEKAALKEDDTEKENIKELQKLTISNIQDRIEKIEYLEELEL